MTDRIHCSLIPSRDGCALFFLRTAGLIEDGEKMRYILILIVAISLIYLGGIFSCLIRCDLKKKFIGELVLDYAGKPILQKYQVIDTALAKGSLDNSKHFVQS